MARVVLGVSGGIAAYKAVEVLRLLTEAGHAVRVIPTRSALKFVGAATFAALSGEPVTADAFDDAHEVPHVRLGQTADLVVVAPATADLLSRAVAGRADDLLAATLLTARCPVVYAPAMHTEMWEHPATVANVRVLRERGAVVLDPDVGPLAKGDVGPGRLPSPESIVSVALAALAGASRGTDLAGRRVVVSAGGTREYLDPVRFLGNRSSGRQGYALARTAAARGAEVTLVSANAALPDPAGVKVVRVVSADDLRRAVLDASNDADAVVMAAAVADFRPAVRASSKLKKSDADPAPVALVRNPDVLAELSAAKPVGQVVVGFAAETDDVLANGREKLARKGCDLLVVNEVGEGLAFDVEDNAAVVLGADGSETDVPRGSKDALAHAVWDLVVARL
ncbi:MAG: phosphopantothenoylcysteine decarboxylase / phosphopantothenate---cysteine ligase [Frankiaceae bacterium]|nr:phosphopantothenoylcysteine decarboxylase / phosphopantothenate---cysteine ligase [Frankiaceae bacterium]